MAKKDKINYNFSVSKILDIGGSIRYTLRYSKKFHDIGIGEFLNTIFSVLVRLVGVIRVVGGGGRKVENNAVFW